LSGVGAVIGPTGGGSNTLTFRADDGGSLMLGDVTSTGRTHLLATGPAAQIRVNGSLFMTSPSSIMTEFGALIRLKRNFEFTNTNTSSLVLSAGRIHMNGDADMPADAQRLEVGGADLGLPTGSIPLNFQIGQLIVGDHDQPTLVRLVDSINNGNRGPNGEPEALYLQGFPAENGLRIRGGSTLILDGVDLYAVVNNEWTHINDLFPKGESLIEFDDGFIGIIRAGDLNGDGVVDVSDLLILLAAWGPCPRSGNCPADLNGDGAVDVSDLLILLANWG
jgi:hypothetical protein